MQLQLTELQFIYWSSPKHLSVWQLIAWCSAITELCSVGQHCGYVRKRLAVPSFTGGTMRIRILNKYYTYYFLRYWVAVECKNLSLKMWKVVWFCCELETSLYLREFLKLFNGSDHAGFLSCSIKEHSAQSQNRLNKIVLLWHFLLPNWRLSYYSCQLVNALLSIFSFVSAHCTLYLGHSFNGRYALHLLKK